MNLTAHSRRRLVDLAGGDDVEVKCYKLNQELTIGSTQSQRRGDITRRNNRVCYRAPGEERVMFAMVLHFTEVSGTQELFTTPSKMSFTYSLTPLPNQPQTPKNLVHTSGEEAGNGEL
jgi:hypothetical protein